MNLTVKEQIILSQVILKKLGYYLFNIDGIWGAKSGEAMSRFCKDKKIEIDDTSNFDPSFLSILKEYEKDRFDIKPVLFATTLFLTMSFIFNLAFKRFK